MIREEDVRYGDMFRFKDSRYDRVYMFVAFDRLGGIAGRVWHGVCFRVDRQDSVDWAAGRRGFKDDAWERVE